MLEDDDRRRARAEQREEQRVDRRPHHLRQARPLGEAVAGQEHLRRAEVGERVGVEVVAGAGMEKEEVREGRDGDDEREVEAAAHAPRFYPRSSESNSSGRAERTRASSTLMKPCRTRRTSESSSEIIPTRLPSVISETRFVKIGRASCRER